MSENERDISVFQSSPWKALDPAVMGLADAVPTMLSPEEQRFYYWVAATCISGAGDIVDLGSFAGGSTARLAAGSAASSHTAKVWAFDRFRANPKAKRKWLYPTGIAPFEGQDIRWLAEEYLRPWAPNVRLQQGEITQDSWNGAPIEILTVDAAKSPTSADQIAAGFFPALIPGVSLVIHQDFLHWSQPWIAAQMHRLGSCFEPLSIVRRDTIVYLCRKQVSAAALEAARTEHLTDDQLMQDVAATLDRFRGQGISNRISRMMEGLRLNPGVRTAWKMTRKPGKGARRPTV